MKPIAVVGLGYGDEGKGATVDWLCATRRVGAVVRFNGGPQAGHNVVMSDGREHTFSQFGSGTLRGVPTFLSRFVAIDPLAMAMEAEHLVELGVDPWAHLSVDNACILVTPYHRERQRLGDPNGSCGSGYGLAVSETDRQCVLTVRKLLSRDPRVPDILKRQEQSALAAGVKDCPPPAVVQSALLETTRRFDAITRTTSWLSFLASHGPLVFEGAQGVLLDQHVGFHPYTTWSNCTFDNADFLANEAGIETPYKLGVLRAGMTTRHGPGPHVSESSRAPVCPNEANVENEHQGPLRGGWFDAVALEYAVRVANPDGLAATQLDVVEPERRFAAAYQASGEWFIDRLPDPPDSTDLLHRQGFTESIAASRPVLHDRGPGTWARFLSNRLGCDVVLGSVGPTTMDRYAIGDLLPWVQSRVGV